MASDPRSAPFLARQRHGERGSSDRRGGDHGDSALGSERLRAFWSGRHPGHIAVKVRRPASPDDARERALAWAQVSGFAIERAEVVEFSKREAEVDVLLAVAE